MYSKPFVDYNVNFGTGFLPAHVVGEKALGISDPTQAVEAIQTAAQKDDKASLAKIANFWNTGFDFTSLPSDKSLYLSSGAVPADGLQGEPVHDLHGQPGLHLGSEAEREDDHLPVPERRDHRRPGGGQR